MILCPDSKITCVKGAYVLELRDHTRNRAQVLVKPIEDPKTQLYQDALAFFNLAQKLGESLLDLAKCALDLYPADYCKAQYGKTYFPFAAMVGAQARRRLLTEWPALRNPVEDDMRVERCLCLMRGFKKEIAISLLRAGVIVGTDRSLQNRVMGRLKYA